VNPAARLDTEFFPRLCPAVDVLIVVKGNGQVVGRGIQQFDDNTIHVVGEVLAFVHQNGVIFFREVFRFLKRLFYDQVVVGRFFLFPCDRFVQDFRAKFKEMKDVHTVFAQGHLLFRQQPFDEIDQCDVVADEQDTFDGRVLLHKQSGPVNQNKGLAGPRGAGDDAMTAIDFAGNGFLVVIQHFDSVLLLFVLCRGITFGQFNPDHGEDQLTEVIELIRRQVKVKGGRVFLLQGFEKGLAGRVTADV